MPYQYLKFGLLCCLTILLSFIPIHIKNEDKPVQARDEKNTMEVRIGEVLKDQRLQGAIAGISVRAADTGEVIFDHFGDIRLRPASNMKLLTSAAALSVLGENYRLKTEVLTEGMVVGNILQGNVYLKGKGDPTLLKQDFDTFAKEIKKNGISMIQGDIVGDDSWYDSIRYSEDLPWSDETEYYGAQVSALTASPNEDFDAGTVIVNIKPGKKIGDFAQVSLHPKTDYVTLVNRIRTNNEPVSEEDESYKVYREHGTNTIVLEGTVSMSIIRERKWVPVWEPSLFALDLFRQSLLKQGIVHVGKIRMGFTPPTANVLYTHESMPLSELLNPFMKLSNNGHGEILVKEMGKRIKGEGSWEMGLDVMKSELSHLGMDVETMVIRDGSGISHVNLIPANEISRLLFKIQSKPWFPVFLNSLPVGGVSDRKIGGTLRNRMNEGISKERTRAKTGTITTVTSLAGYVEAKSGKTLIFSILINNVLDEEDAKEIEDRIVEILAES